MNPRKTSREVPSGLKQLTIASNGGFFNKVFQIEYIENDLWELYPDYGDDKGL